MLSKFYRDKVIPLTNEAVFALSIELGEICVQNSITVYLWKILSWVLILNVCLHIFAGYYSILLYRLLIYITPYEVQLITLNFFYQVVVKLINFLSSKPWKNSSYISTNSSVVYLPQNWIVTDVVVPVAFANNLGQSTVLAAHKRHCFARQSTFTVFTSICFLLLWYESKPDGSRCVFTGYLCLLSNRYRVI